jgi:hypothetical protein
MKRFALLLGAIVALGCGDGADRPDADGAGGGTCVSPECVEPTDACPSGFHEDPDGGCRVIVSEAECPVGTRPVVGSSSCAPVGWTDCPAGFVPDPSGWGCADVVPTSACQGATRDAVGESACQPIGDCDAAFPPADATYFVRASYSDAELDATHFRAIGDAVAAAPSGAVIAVDEGVYVEALAISAPISLVGRCAEKVVLQSDGGDAEGIRIDGARDVGVRGITIAGHRIGVRLTHGTLQLEEALLTGNRWVAVGAVGSSVAHIARTVVRDTVPDYAAGPTHAVLVAPGARVDLLQSAIVDTPYASLVVEGHGAVATMTETIVRDGHPEPEGPFAAEGGYGVIIMGGGALQVDRSVLLDNHAAAIGVTGSDSQGTPSSGLVVRTVIRGQMPNSLGAARGLEAADGARLTVEDSTVALCQETQLIATHPATMLRAERVVLRGPIIDDGSASGLGAVASDQARVELVSAAVVSNRTMGVLAQMGGEMDVTDSVIRDGLPALEPTLIEDEEYYYGLGAAVLPGSRLSLTSSALLHNRAMSVFVRGVAASATINGTLIDDTLVDEDGIYGRGINVQDGASLDLFGSAVLRSHDTGVVVFGSDATVTDSVVAQTQRDQGATQTPALALAAADGAHLEVTRTTLSGSVDIGVLVSRASGFITGVVLARNAIGLHVQDGSILVEQATPSTDPLTVVVAPNTRFVGNEARLGAGILPIPSPVPTESP